MPASRKAGNAKRPELFRNYRAPDLWRFWEASNRRKSQNASDKSESVLAISLHMPIPQISPLRSGKEVSSGL